MLLILAVVPAQFAVAAAKPQAAAAGQSAATPAASAATPPAAKEEPFYLHAKHVGELSLDCNTCHLPVKEGSVNLQRPGHDQCTTCHQEAFDKVNDQKICLQCHNEFPPTGADDLYPFPRFKKQRPILVDFSHAKHVDPHMRIDPKTGMRADCSFCHQTSAKGDYYITHEQCAACHSKAGMKPMLSPTSTTADCQGCHNPQAIENPTLRKISVPADIVTGSYKKIRFSHQYHFEHRGKLDMNCTSCHSGVPHSASLATLELPGMAACGTCHSQQLAANKRMDNCATCHANPQTGVALVEYSRWVKPAFHDESFRQKHPSWARNPGAQCYICHTGVSSTATPDQRCEQCHRTMKPASHTVRWRDDVHGKFAALDRETCATCHVSDTCVRCHNQTPRSHQPLAFFKGGAHARLAMLNERSCFVCHTFANTCAECHSK
jgi:hypothetical protein